MIRNEGQAWAALSVVSLEIKIKKEGVAKLERAQCYFCGDVSVHNTNASSHRREWRCSIVIEGTLFLGDSAFKFVQHSPTTKI